MACLKHTLQREIVGRTVDVCLPDNFLNLYHSDIKTGLLVSGGAGMSITRSYSNVPVLLFAHGELVNLRFALNDWARNELLRCQRACLGAPSSPASRSAAGGE